MCLWIDCKNTKWNDGIINFSQMLLTLASWCGIGFTVLSFIMILVIILRKIIFGDPVAVGPSLVCVITFIGGIQLFCMGIIGQYLAKIYFGSEEKISLYNF